MTSHRILIVEDDEAIRTALVAKLDLEGYRVTFASDGEEARRKLEESIPDLVLLDLMLPELDGISLLQWLRRRDRSVPVLILSAKGREEQKIEGLKAGADDYLAKPFGLGELVARIEALLRRANPVDSAQKIGELSIDLDGERIERRGEPVDLSKIEWRLLSFLISKPATPHSRERIQMAVWDDPDSSDPRAVDYHVMNLRRKLEEDPSQPALLVTRHGRGYEWTGRSNSA